MSTRSAAFSGFPRNRNVNSVQRVLRAMIWFGVFLLLIMGTFAVSFIANLIAPGAGYLAFVVGGLASLIVPGMMSSTLYIIPEYERVVLLKLGEFVEVRGPGRFWVIPYPPFYQSVAARLDTRVQTRVITAAQTLTEDNVPVGTEAVIFWRVENPQRAALEVVNYAEATFQAANSALKDAVGTLELSELLGEREKVSAHLKQTIDKAAASFGVDVSSVEITDVHVPQDLIQELSVLAQSRRAAQAKIAEAAAEEEIAQSLQAASAEMGPRAMEMYRLNVLERIGREEGSQIVIYGLGSQDANLEQTLAATAAGSQLRSSSRPPSEQRTSAAPPASAR